MIKKNVTEKLIQVDKTAELLPFLIEKLPSKSRDNIKSLLRNKIVLVDGKTQSHAKFELHPGQQITIGKKEEKLPTIPGISIRHEDEHIIVVEKPAGLLTISTENEKSKTLFRYLSQYVKIKEPNTKIFVVHRLDRETSGLLVFAKNEQAKFRLQKNWNDNVIERTYIAVVEGRLKDTKKTIESYLRESKALIVHSSQNETYGQKAITHYEVLEQRTNSALVKLNLETGRKNQIRVHMKDIGHPIFGDKKYGSKIPMPGRIALHAKSLAFKHPVSNQTMSFDTKIPREFFKK